MQDWISETRKLSNESNLTQKQVIDLFIESIREKLNAVVIYERIFGGDKLGTDNVDPYEQELVNMFTRKAHGNLSDLKELTDPHTFHSKILDLLESFREDLHRMLDSNQELVGDEDSNLYKKLERLGVSHKGSLGVIINSLGFKELSDTILQLFNTHKPFSLECRLISNKKSKIPASHIQDKGMYSKFDYDGGEQNQIELLDFLISNIYYFEYINCAWKISLKERQSNQLFFPNSNGNSNLIYPDSENSTYNDVETHIFDMLKFIEEIDAVGFEHLENFVKNPSIGILGVEYSLRCDECDGITEYDHDYEEQTKYFNATQGGDFETMQELESFLSEILSDHEYLGYLLFSIEN